jgi:hypothetical protein
VHREGVGLDERALVEQQVDALPGGQLALGRAAWRSPLAAAGAASARRRSSSASLSWVARWSSAIVAVGARSGILTGSVPVPEAAVSLAIPSPRSASARARHPVAVHHHLETVTSTNDVALAAAREGSPLGSS